MSEPRIVRWRDLAARPWKNGGGETVDIAAGPEGATIEDFAWRVSVATVAREGPFSIFPNVDRTISVIEGEGLILAFDDGETVAVDEGGEPFGFSGDRPCVGRLRHGATRDLNAMTRRGRASHRVRRLDMDAPATIHAVGKPTIIFVAKGTAAIAGEELGRFDAAILAKGDWTITPTAPSAVYMIDILR